MKFTATVKLAPEAGHASLLLETLERANAACNWISEQAWQAKQFGQTGLHHPTYQAARDRFDLGAQMVVRRVAKVVQAYQADHKTHRTFKPHGAVAYDERILNWRAPDRVVSIWTLEGRMSVPFTAGERQLAVLKCQKGESDLGHEVEHTLFETYPIVRQTMEMQNVLTQPTPEFLNIGTGQAGLTLKGELIQIEQNIVFWFSQDVLPAVLQVDYLGSVVQVRAVQVSTGTLAADVQAFQ